MLNKLYMTMDGHVENFDAYKVETIGNTCVYAVDVIDDSVIDVVKTKLLPPRVFFCHHVIIIRSSI